MTDLVNQVEGEDHPRSRGEYQGDLKRKNQIAGSSPLSRGILIKNRPPVLHPRIIPALAGNTLLVSVDGAEEVGIIPALAGNTDGLLGCPLLGPDHPRSRGEY